MAVTRLGLCGPSDAYGTFQPKTPVTEIPEQPCKRGQRWDPDRGECVGAGLDVEWNECAETGGIKVAT